MRAFLAVAIFLLVGVAIGAEENGAMGTSKNMENFRIDLSVRPQDRWNEVVDAYHDQLLEVVSKMPGMFPEEIRGDLVAKSNFIGDHLEESMGEYGLEMQGIANRLNVTNGSIVLVNVIYEVTFVWACTSIVAQAEDGSVLHGRNQDLGNNIPQANFLRDIVFKVVFDNGDSTYHGNTFAGYVGLPTGLRPDNGWSISLDATVDLFTKKEEFYNIVYGLIDGMVRGDAKLVTLLTRSTLQNVATYSEAVEVMGNTPIIGPVYAIMAGPEKGDGVVITRNRTVAWDYWELAGSKYGWFLVETNYNHWERNPIEDPRRQVAVSCMNSVGQANITLKTLYGCLSQPPVMNWLTTYTAVMDPSTNEYDSYVRWPLSTE